MPRCLNIIIRQGATFATTLRLGSAYDGLVPRATIRDRFGGAEIATLTCSTVASGLSTLSLSAAQTAALPAGPSSDRQSVLGVFDVETESSGVVIRHAEGIALMSREATT